MCKNVLLGPAGQVEGSPHRQEIEAGLRQLRPSFARQHAVEPGLQLVQMHHVGRGVGELRIGELFSAPVRALLGFRHVESPAKLGLGR